MAQSDVIREFLVALGFKVDESSLRKFSDNIESATKNVGALVLAVEAAAVAVKAATIGFANEMEKLYFASKKSGASATNLKALSNTLENFGVSADEAMGSVQSLARWMRNTPGSEEFLKGIGVEARDANGELRDTTDIMAELGGKLKAQPYYMAKEYAGLFGISEDTLRAMRNGEFEAELEKQRRLLKDAGYEKATEDAHKFDMKLRELETRIKAIGVQIGTALLDTLGPGMERTAQWFEENGDQVRETVTAISNAIVTIGNIAGPILGKIAEGWKNIYNWVKFAGEKINEVMPKSWGDKIGAGTAWLFDKLGIKEQMENLVIGGSSKSPSKDPLAYFMGQGWSKDQAAGIVANLRAESGLKANATGDNGQAYGIAQWHPDRQANFAKWAGHDIKNSTLDEQMGFVNWELTKGAEQKAGALLRASQNAQQAGEVMSRYYERPLQSDAEAAKRGAAAVQIAQNTTINVHGGDPVSTGRAVANEQSRVNMDLKRNMASAVS